MQKPISMPLPRALYRAAQVRELDRLAIERHGIAGYTLMNRAGEAACAVLRARWPHAQRIVVVCGGGNNGGDGYAIARLLHAAGMQVRALFLTDPAGLNGDAFTAYQDARAAGVVSEPFAAEWLTDADVIVDAILGIGLEREVTGAWRAAIEAINARATPRLAVDIPSGLHADTGAVLGAAVQAEATVSFIGLKQGLLTGQGPAYCGTLYFADLDVPNAIYADIVPASERYQGDDLAALLPPRPRTAHKGDCGHVLVIGGDHGLAGAARMSAEAAARCGAGLTSVATRPEHAAVQAALRPEVMFCGVTGPAELAPLMARASVLAVGPGLGTQNWGVGLLDAALECDLPLVLDADALNLLVQRPRQRANWILTPHPGEAARLLGQTTAEVQADRVKAVATLVERYGGVAVLKGAGSLIASAEAPPAVCHAGNPGMASGGMGDVLTGVIAALVAQGLALRAAAQSGVYLHARAADLAALDGERGLLATDLLPHLRRLINP